MEEPVVMEYLRSIYSTIILKSDSQKEYKEYGLFGTTSFVLGR
jgi:hypothetical protein